MDESAPSLTSQRLVSLDVFRGITIAGMLLVNNPGSWGHVYWPLLHADWNGWTLTDLIFPFFLFIVGVAMMFSFPKRLARGASRRVLFGHVVRRSLGLMILGYLGGTFSAIVFANETTAAGLVFRGGFVLLAVAALVLLTGTRAARLGTLGLVAGGIAMLAGGLAVAADDSLLQRLAELRLPGVLVRIAWCYLLAAAIYFLTPSPRAILIWIAALLAIYWIWMVYVPIPGFGLPDLSRGFPTLETPRDELFSNWCFSIDYHVLGTHVWSARKLHDPATGALIWSFDPEGILSTVTATSTVLLGVLTGLWLKRPDKTPPEKTNGLYAAGCWLLAAGLVMSIWLPINKRIWTSSYTVFTAGMALLFLATCYYTVDVKGHRGWCRPFVWYGTNAITAFVLSGMIAQVLGQLGWKTWLMENGFQRLLPTPNAASLAYAVCFVAVWAGLMGLMHWRRVYLRL